MPSSLDVINRALDSIAVREIVQDINEDSTSAIAAKLWYTQVRNQVLCAATWGFAKRQTTLAPRAEPAYRPWLYSYEFPDRCLVVRYLGDGAFPAPFSVAATDDGRAIHTNLVGATATFTALIENLDLWSIQALNALEFALAGSMAMGLTGDLRRTQLMLQQANSIIMSARVADANEDLTVLAQPIPDWLAVRGVVGEGNVSNMGPNVYGPLFTVT